MAPASVAAACFTAAPMTRSDRPTRSWSAIAIEVAYRIAPWPTVDTTRPGAAIRDALSEDPPRIRRQ